MRPARALAILTAVSVAVAALLGLNATTSAYTLSGKRWKNPDAAFIFLNSYLSQGAGWKDRALEAMGNYTAHTPFTYWEGTTSLNDVSALDLSSQCSSCLARTFYSYNPANNELAEADIQVNTGSGYAFYDGTQGSSIPPNYYDLASVMRHELGHGLGLCHSGTEHLVMYAYLDNGHVHPFDNDVDNGTTRIYDPSYSGPDPEGGCLS